MINCYDVKIVSLVFQALLQLAGCVANTGVAPLMRTQAWVWHSPSPMNLDTSKGFWSTHGSVLTLENVMKSHVVVEVGSWPFNPCLTLFDVHHCFLNCQLFIISLKLMMKLHLAKNTCKMDNLSTSPVLEWSMMVKGTFVRSRRATSCLPLWPATTASSPGLPAAASTSAASSSTYEATFSITAVLLLWRPLFKELI